MYKILKHLYKFLTSADMTIVTPSVVDLEILPSVPKKTIINFTVHCDKKIQCEICLQVYQKNQEVSKIVSCGHFFHQGCLSQWKQQQQTCPCCRCEF